LGDLKKCEGYSFEGAKYGPTPNSNNLFRFLVELDIILPAWPLSIYKMTINKEMRLIIQQLIPNSSHKDLGFDVAPL